MYSDEQLEIRALAREFAGGEIRPRAWAWDEERSLDDEIFSKLAELGFLGMLIPEEYGGLGLDLVTYLLALEELAWGDASVALSVAIHNGPVAGLLLRHGSEDQKGAWLPRLAAGEVVGAFALSEPQAGSDAAAVSTRARKEGDGWVLSGTKAWVTNGRRSGLVVTFARTGPESRGRNGVGAFLVGPTASGYRVRECERTMGLAASETVTVELEGVELGPDALVGDPDEGYGYAMEAIDLGRVGISAQALGIAQAAFEFATGYALERAQFGRPIADFGAVQEKLATMAVRIEEARALTHVTGSRFQGRIDGDGRSGPGLRSLTAAAAMAKLTASEAAMWVTNQAVQIYGGYGYMRDYPVEKLMRDAKATQIYEGTNEIQRVIIAEALAEDG